MPHFYSRPAGPRMDGAQKRILQESIARQILPSVFPEGPLRPCYITYHLDNIYFILTGPPHPHCLKASFYRFKIPYPRGEGKGCGEYDPEDALRRLLVSNRASKLVDKAARTMGDDENEADGKKDKKEDKDGGNFQDGFEDELALAEDDDDTDETNVNAKDEDIDNRSDAD